MTDGAATVRNAGDVDGRRRRRTRRSVIGVDRTRTIVAAVPFPPVLAADAARAPRALVEVGQFATEFGTSGYMFATSALLAAVALVALEHRPLGPHRSERENDAQVLELERFLPDQVMRPDRKAL